MKLLTKFKTQDGSFLTGYDSEKDCYTIQTSIQNLEISTFDFVKLYLQLRKLKKQYLKLEEDDEDSKTD